ncbi:unnamed protein product [Linum tenue]|uniref:GH18 domain-containing protein n=1 Tax=Linum tenue TaxID=586396 RepID=A0AAV0IDW3_9ROSI|nr:unnamed protein product [Linum tenue]
MAHQSSLLLLLITIFLPLHLPFSAAANVRGGYWFPGGGFPISAIESTLFTHLFCAFADLDPSTYGVTISPENQPQFWNFTPTVAKRNPLVKTLLSIGGAGANSSALAYMAGNPTARQVFFNSSMGLARSYGFDGLDLDWEFPRSGKEMADFGTLVDEWRVAVNVEAVRSGKPPLILSAAVYYSPFYSSPLVAYPTQSISNSLDWINVMAYDFYAPGWSPNITGPPAALHNPDQPINVDIGITTWIQQGLPAEKVVLGLPFYGYAWSLVDSNQTGLYVPANGTNQPWGGAMTYNQINQFIAQQNGTNNVFNATVVSQYCYNGTTWIGYDGLGSIFGKVLYAKTKGLGGYFAWHVGADDDWSLSTTGSF